MADGQLGSLVQHIRRLVPGNATSAAADEAIMVALSTAVAVAVSAVASGADAGEMPHATISGNDTAVDTTDAVSGSDAFAVNSGAALKLDPISQSAAPSQKQGRSRLMQAPHCNSMVRMRSMGSS